MKRNKSNHTTRFLSVYTRLVFLKLLDDELNERLENIFLNIKSNIMLQDCQQQSFRD